jgi:hypothetical protein
MEFSVRKRKNKLKQFMKNLAKKYEDVTTEDTNVLNLFDSTYLSEGSEGTVAKATFKNQIDYIGPLAIKTVSLPDIYDTKQIYTSILKMSPEKLYKFFLSFKPFNKPSLTELISNTLVNQLVFQRICPHFCLNYYWDYQDKSINMFNEYANSYDFDTWAKRIHGEEMWFNALFQIMIGLIALQSKFRMVHTDFHTKNILVQRVEPGGYWTYIVDGHKYYLPNLGYIFLINDFGFAWIPEKLYIAWHYKDTLQYISNNGLKFYDMSSFLQTILTYVHYDIPDGFKKFISTNFSKEEVTYLFVKKYYKNRLAKNKYDKYPDIKKNYLGIHTTLQDKLYDFFYTGKYSFRHKIEDSFRIESYSLDKKFDKSKLTTNMRHLVR